MKVKVLKFILTLFSTKEMINLFSQLFSFLKEYFGAKKTEAENKKTENESKKEQEYLEKAEDVANNGDVQDLLNLRK